MDIACKRLADGATLPSRAYAGDAGLDMYAAADVSIAPGARGMVHTGIACAIPEGYVGLVWDKSGRAFRDGLKTLGGVIDAGYRGEVCIGLANLSGETVHIKQGEKVAQLLVQQVEPVHPVEVADLADTERGEQGFGSSGI